MAINHIKFSPDFEENPHENLSQNPKIIQQKINDISKNINFQNPEIKKLLSDFSDKIAFFIENHRPIPTSVLNILHNIEKNQKAVPLDVQTLQKILVS